MRHAARGEDLGATGDAAHAPALALEATQEAAADVARCAREEHGHSSRASLVRAATARSAAPSTASAAAAPAIAP